MTTSQKILMPIGDATEALDTFYPYFRLPEDGFEVVVAGPEARLYHSVLHEIPPNSDVPWDITQERPGYHIRATVAFRDLRADDYAGLFRETVGGKTYLLSFVTPPAAANEADAKPVKREIVFVIDNSGSMAGPSMEQAKESLALAISRLKPEDRFNVIRFDDTMSVHFPELVEAILDVKAEMFVIDGEIVIPQDGAFSFDALLQRIHPAPSRVDRLARETPAVLIAFDLLAGIDGSSLLRLPLRERRRGLEAFARRYFKRAEHIRLSPATTRLSVAGRGPVAAAAWVG